MNDSPNSPNFPPTKLSHYTVPEVAKWHAVPCKGMLLIKLLLHQCCLYSGSTALGVLIENAILIEEIIMVM